MTADVLAALTALETATEGSRELDTLIWLLVTPGSTHSQRSYTHKATGRECTVEETRVLQAEGNRMMVTVPAYTTSIDAALTLVPEGCDYLTGRGRNKPSEPLHGALIYDGDDHAMELGRGEHEASLAMALVIAALRARAGRDA